MKADLEVLELLILMLKDITPEHDTKLQQLVADLKNKFEHPINGTNRKVLIFTALPIRQTIFMSSFPAGF